MNFPRRRFLQFAGAAAIAPAFLRVRITSRPFIIYRPTTILRKCEEGD